MKLLSAELAHQGCLQQVSQSPEAGVPYFRLPPFKAQAHTMGTVARPARVSPSLGLPAEEGQSSPHNGPDMLDSTFATVLGWRKGLAST